ncbi:CPBP family intramembrane glutamic endopeptidase [Hymenobacter sp. UYCo722]|uniref:CPBP family intramembrane glutamic endopeptidase n=1 Tax=Hymenobacter sp. UYCo722 TaxID=3156335 RepID=UPI003398DF82
MLHPSAQLLLYASCYLLFLGLLWVCKSQRAHRLFDEDGLVATPWLLMALHVGGIILFGIIPAVLPHQPAFAARSGPAETMLPTTITVLLTVFISLFAPRLAEKKYRALPRAEASASLGSAYISTYFLVRVVFICAYESWFRGGLLQDSTAHFGAPAAVLLNVALYAALHLVNGKAETLGCLPFGALLCGLCLWQGAVWPAIALHLALTLPYEFWYWRNIPHFIPLRHENLGNGSVRLHR